MSLFSSSAEEGDKRAAQKRREASGEEVVNEKSHETRDYGDHRRRRSDDG